MGAFASWYSLLVCSTFERWTHRLDSTDRGSGKVGFPRAVCVKFMEYLPNLGEISTKEKLRCQLSVEAKAIIWASMTLILLVYTNIHTSIAFNKDISMIIIPVAENTWMGIAYVLLIYGCIRQRFEPLSFLLVVTLPSLLFRFVGILLCIMMAAFPDSYTRKLNRLGDDVEEEKVRLTAIILVSISLVVEVFEVVTAIYTLICRYHLKEVCAQRRRREAALRRRQNRSVDRAVLPPKQPNPTNPPPPPPQQPNNPIGGPVNASLNRAK